MKSNYAAAFVLLGGLVVVGSAGIVAVSASHDQTAETLQDNGITKPGVLNMGRDMWSSLFVALPWLALVAVPLGIVGLLGAVASGSSSRRAMR